jgi:cobalt/nickel transport system ATP-binding protein
MNPILEVSNLSFSFPREAPILSEISFTVAETEKVALVGANGAGKSTLLWCALGLLHGQGQVRLFGEKRTAASLRRIGVVFQNPEDHLFMPSLREDLTLPLLQRGFSREAAACKAAQALSLVGLESLDSKPARKLSLGQRKRAAIAAALVNDPDLLVLDEPTAELDGRSRRELVSLLRSLPSAMLIASHDLDFLNSLVDRVLALDGGTLAGSFSASTFFSDTDFQERLRLT